MNARQPKGAGERRVSDDEIIGWVTPKASRAPSAAAWADMEEIVKEHAAALKEAVSKLTLNA